MIFEQNKIFTLQTKNTTYQMMADQYGYLLHLYYGAKIKGTTEHLLSYWGSGFSGNPDELGYDRSYSLDLLPQEYPTLGTGDFRNVALIVKNEDGSESCCLKYKGHKIYNGKYALKGLPAAYATEEEAQTLEIYMEDAITNVQVTLLYGVIESLDIITRSAIITNGGTTNIVIEKAGSASLDFLPGNYDLISFYGRHAMERNFQRSEVIHGTTTLGSKRGASSHQCNPTVIVADKNTTEDTGACYGMAFVYSGGFQFEVEKDQFNVTRAIMGLQPQQLAYPLQPEEQLVIPETILSFTKNGFSQLSQNYHNCIRKHIIRDVQKKRPILINSWEAAYFSFNGDTIVQLAKDAKELGIEMVVMDDGWFGKRDGDCTGLGDWFVNEKKIGYPLNEMVQKINDLGVQFGIWIEPEMVSEDSDLYRNHPDWAIQIPGRKPNRSRYQLVLDFSREEVRNHVLKQICEVLDNINVAYIKMDMNRSICDVYSQANVVGKVLYDYVIGVYDFIEQLRIRYPHVLIEGCSGGGGRYDVGMMYYTPQIWCSDNTDAINRTKIQYGSSFFYPMSAMGSHVSEVPNHQTNRRTSLHTRGVVAMAGVFGYELNPQRLSEKERERIKEQVKTYKKYEHYVQNGNYYRLSSPYTESYVAWLFVSEDKKQALFSVVKLEKQANTEAAYVKLKGLLEDQMYTDVATGKKYHSSILMEAGVSVPRNLCEYDAWQVEFKVEA